MTKINISEEGLKIYCGELFLLLKLPFEELSLQCLKVTGMYMALEEICLFLCIFFSFLM